MVQIIRTEEYASWSLSLRDDRAKAKIALRIDRLALGNPGDVKPVGGGLSEMRIDYGAGYRVYYGKHGDSIILLLCGGTKNGQSRDVKKAKALFETWKTSNDQNGTLRLRRISQFAEGCSILHGRGHGERRSSIDNPRPRCRRSCQEHERHRAKIRAFSRESLPVLVSYWEA